MLTQEEVEATDVSGLYKDYEEWPKHSEDALKLPVETPDAARTNQVIYAGMGGSAASGDLLKDWLTPIINLPFTVVKDYTLPRSAGKNTLVLAVSCSGDTEETLSAANQAYERGCRIAAISSGGRLEQFCRKKSIPFTKTKKLRVPRSSLPNLFYPAANILKEAGLVKTVADQIPASVSAIKQLYSEVRAANSNGNPAKELAVKIADTLPIIYCFAVNEGAANRFRAALNENAKIQAHVAVIPELCHNEVEGWTKRTPRVCLPVYIRSKEELPENAARFEAVKEMIEAAGFKVHEVWESGDNSLSRIMRSVYLFDYTSIYTAVLRRTNPIGTPNIDAMKRRLREG
ncbi:MAG: bifunctional phosphoglucose/phosphomannose isomerase [Thaumarchaeota archaeon]|nr:bifunctional phosphoglucose/phosphomannose isomerase [Nitrososphaerota archaeon]MCL5318907.1 bifunctional phosphoglucose/phosphomannose isomerase [Nitrososphaerota archaeon]